MSDYELKINDKYFIRDSKNNNKSFYTTDLRGPSDDYLSYNRLNMQVWIFDPEIIEYMEISNYIYGIYDRVKRLNIYSDTTNNLPQIMNNFNNLRTLKLSGCRWWYLEMSQIPISTQRLLLDEMLCIENPLFFKGMDKLINLRNLQLYIDLPNGWLFNCYDAPTQKNADMSEIMSNWFAKPHIPIANLAKLKCIEFIGDSDNHDQDMNLWIQMGKQNPLFSKIKHRIKSIKYDSKDINQKKIIVRLSPI